MDEHVMVGYFDKRDFVRVDAADLFLGTHLQGHGGVLVGQHPARPVHLGGKFLVAHGLEHIVERTYRISLDGVLGEHGDKNDHHPVVHLPDALGRVDAQHIRHLNVHEQNVRVALVFSEEGNGAVIQL